MRKSERGGTASKGGGGGKERHARQETARARRKGADGRLVRAAPGEAPHAALNLAAPRTPAGAPTSEPASAGRARLGSPSREDLSYLAGWVVRTSEIACALVRDGQVVLSNNAFSPLNHAEAGPWRALPAPGSATRSAATFATLTHLVVAEAERLRRDRQAPIRHCRAYAGAGRTVELTLQKTLGRRPAILALVHDISDRVQLEAALGHARELLLKRERTRAIGELAQGVAHDVNNILAALDLRVQVLLHDPACRAAQGDNLNAVLRIIHQGSDLVTRLQRFGRPSDGALTAVDLATVVREAIEIATSGLNLECALRSGGHIAIDNRVGAMPAVRGSAPELLHVFTNLLINARDAMPDGGRITISARATDAAVIVALEDEGEGISAQVLPHLFEPFVTSKKDDGHGLGLSMARTIMEACGGGIGARNRAEGGACFELIFRRTEPAVTTPKRTSRARGRGGATPLPSA